MRRHVIVLGAVIGLLAAACSGHSSTGSTDEGATSQTTAAATQLAPGQFGTMSEPVCGPGDASGATDQGVTNDSIEVGTISDPGNTIIPGLLQELFDASDAFVNWCNQAGGINGRPIKLVKRDTKLLEGQQRIAEACASDFMLVGGGSGLDGSLVEPRIGCGLPQMQAFLNDPAAISAGDQIIMAGANTPDTMSYGQYRLVVQAHPEVAPHFGLLAANVQSTGPDITQTLPPVLDQFGITTVYTSTTPPPPSTVDNWRPYLEPAVNAGVQMFEFRQTAPQTVAAMNAFVDVGFKPEVMIGNPSQYDGALIQGNDTLGDLSYYVGVYTYPFELADQYQPIKQFLDIMDASVPGWSNDPKSLAVNSWSTWLLWAQSAKACGSNLTRDCVMNNASNVQGWDAGGVVAPYDIVDGKAGPQPCVAVLDATPQGFTYDEAVTQPDTGIFNCDKANLAQQAQ